MQVSTATFYNDTAKRLGSLNARAQTLQVEISTGKKVLSPSDAPEVSQQLAEIAQKDTDSQAYAANLKTADSLLSQTDSTIKQMIAQVTRVKELALNGANGTLGSNDLKTIGTEMASTLEAIVGLANVDNIRGEPLFGTTASVKAVTLKQDGTYLYAPTNVSPIPIAAGQDVQATEGAARLFKLPDGTDLLATINTLATALQTGDATAAASANSALDTLQKGLDQLGDVQASVGARGARVDLQQNLLQTANTDRADLRSKLEDTDMTQAIVELQQMMSALSATQASFSKLAQLSIFDYIR